MNSIISLVVMSPNPITYENVVFIGFRFSQNLSHRQTMAFEPKSSAKDITGLLEWLRSHGACGTSEDCIFIADSVGKGLGVFAAKDFASGEVIFTIPRKCIIGIGDTLTSNIIYRIRGHEEGFHMKNLTEELKIWLHMVEGRINKHSHFHPYLRTLDYEILPSMLEWDPRLLEALKGTNLYKSLQSAVERKDVYQGIVDDINRVMKDLDKTASFQSVDVKRQRLSDNDADWSISLRDILWARSHYMSRRYLGEFASTYDADYVPSHQEGDLGNLGSMCPLLDILNHNSSQDWLELVVEDDFLVVKANVPIVKGSEIFYNYGKLPNEMLLYGYAYADDHNADDGVAIKLMSSVSSHRIDAIGLYYIKQGGLKGIPKVKVNRYQCYI